MDREHRLGQLPIEDGTVDEVCLDVSSLDRIEANISRRVRRLAQMYAVVFFGHEPDDVSWLDHLAVVS